VLIRYDFDVGTCGTYFGSGDGLITIARDGNPGREPVVAPQRRGQLPVVA
jgi:hypothetical protein